MSYYEKNTYSLLLILFKILLFLILDYTDLAASKSCQTDCGGVRIPYPFGVGDGCYLEKAYEIECLPNTTTSTKQLAPFLSIINKEIVGFSAPAQDGSSTDSESVSVASLSFGIVRVKIPMTSRGCSSNKEEAGERPILNLTGMPYFIDYTISLIAVGCNSKVFLTDTKPNVVGCELNCNTSKDSHRIPFFTGCSRNALSNDNYNEDCTETQPEETGRCDSDGCCKARLPSEPQQVIGIRIENNDTTRQHCTVAYLTDEIEPYNLSTKPQQLLDKGYATVSLRWVIQTSNESFLNSLGCKNVQDYQDIGTKCVCEKSNISGITYATCGCLEGYEGNPYILNDCIVIDTCKTEHKYCGVRETCENYPGGYRCVGDKTKTILIGVGGGFGVLVLLGGAWWLRKFLIKRRDTKRKKKFFKRNGGLLLQQKLSTREGNVEKTRIFSSRELEKATENFSENRVLGQGGQGTVYKGMLVDGRTVAVKKSKVIDEDKLQEFINEVVILSQINHRHIVKLFGCCLETEVPILVYEFIHNGNLFQHIHEESDDYTMIWGMRLRIATDMAGALSYLHSSTSSPVYHRDIKSTNILLDEKYRAKVSDFGTSRSVTIDQTHWTTVVSGTVGYMDPEYYRSSQYTEKSDVYSFGVVLAELITGDKPVITVENTRETKGLADHFRDAIKEKRLMEIIDARIRDDCKPEQVKAVANLAMKCLSSKGKKRPNMRQVFTELERIASSTEMHFDENEDEDEEVIEIMNISDSLSIGVSVTAPAASIVVSPSSSDVRLTW